MMRWIYGIFDRLSGRFCYSLPIAVFSVSGGQASALLGFLFILIVTDLPPERIRLYSTLMLLLVPLNSLIHYTLFGLLRPWTRRLELPSLRHLNDWVRGGGIPSAIPLEELSRLTRTLEQLARLNFRLAGLLSGAIVLVAIVIELLLGTPQSAARFVLGGAIAIIPYMIFSTIVTELTVRPVLGQARRMLALRGAWQGPSYQATLTTKFFLLVGLTAISQVVLISLFVLKPRIVRSPIIFWMICAFVLGAAVLVSLLIFHSITRPLDEVEEAAQQLVAAGSAHFFTGSTNREFIRLA
ncbi:MAG: hypothetical protein JXA37_13915, partial [Chloroflexia bacterium]|nr:hypothetical protein [Chloroflexia bacterium]